MDKVKRWILGSLALVLLSPVVVSAQSNEEFDTNHVFTEYHRLTRGWSQAFPDYKWQDPKFYDRGAFDFTPSIDVSEGPLSDKEKETLQKEYKAALDAYEGATGLPKQGSEDYFHFYEGMTYRLNYVLNDVMDYLSGENTNPILNPEWSDRIIEENDPDYYTRREENTIFDAVNAGKFSLFHSTRDFSRSEDFFANNQLALDFFNAPNQSSEAGDRLLDGIGQAHMDREGNEITPVEDDGSNVTLSGFRQATETPVAGSPYVVVDGPWFKDVSDTDGLMTIEMVFSYTISAYSLEDEPYELRYDNVRYTVDFDQFGHIVSYQYEGNPGLDPIKEQ